LLPAFACCGRSGEQATLRPADSLAAAEPKRFFVHFSGLRRIERSSPERQALCLRTAL